MNRSPQASVRLDRHLPSPVPGLTCGEWQDVVTMPRSPYVSADLRLGPVHIDCGTRNPPPPLAHIRKVFDCCGAQLASEMGQTRPCRSPLLRANARPVLPNKRTRTGRGRIMPALGPNPTFRYCSEADICVGPERAA